MVEELIIRNYALIDNLRIEFKEGFNVLTGESGSGKSLVAGALAQLRGGKNNSDIIRKGSRLPKFREYSILKEMLMLKNGLKIKGLKVMIIL